MEGSTGKVFGNSKRIGGVGRKPSKYMYMYKQEFKAKVKFLAG